jgi:5-methylcytosine-specific restriction endonuclease McrA
MWRGGYDYYQNSLWLETRKKALQRDDPTCQGCGASRDELDGPLDVHHVIPINEHESFESATYLDNLITMCQSCHQRWEGVPVVPQRG